ncbi:GIY-YIG nuclease family protein [Kaistia dalseonensis]|uniref:GIY-YIG nuclease family protein n=1 Tax=Kaistia dalseonensis TaxID=410840 RepID=UPI003520B68D
MAFLFVYVFATDAEIVKIGITNNLQRRLAGVATSCPFKLKMEFSIDMGDQAAQVERIAHQLLSKHRKSGEWFSCSGEAAIAAIHRAIRQADGSVEPERNWPALSGTVFLGERVYPVALVPHENGELLVQARDLPEVLTWGKDEAEALAMAEDAIAVVIAAALEDGREIPEPSPVQAGEHLVSLPAQLSAKLAVILAWRASGISKSEMGRRLGLAEGEVRRILDPHHNTKLDKLDAAARVLGQRLFIGISKAA